MLFEIDFLQILDKFELIFFFRNKRFLINILKISAKNFLKIIN
jgi:hypothetical protein